MKLWKLSLAALVIPIFGFIGSGPAEACQAMGQPKITIKLAGDGTGKALISEYDCSMMIPKTNCVVGVRLSDNALADSKIAIRALRFVNLRDGSAVQGFTPAPNQRSTAAWGRVMDGTWYGFSAIFGAHSDSHGGLAIEVSFSYDPTTRPEEITRAFDYGHVGLAEGDPQGGIAHGHMMEVVQIRGASLALL